MSKLLYMTITTTFLLLVSCSTFNSISLERSLASKKQDCRSSLIYFISQNKDSTSTIEAKLNQLPINKNYQVIEEGDNDTFLVTLSDGTRAVFKPDKSLDQKASESEIVAYQVSKTLSFDLVPPTVRRFFNGENGSLQLFIENAVTADRSHIIETDAQELRQQVLDYILINADRNGDNFLIGKGGEIFSIDHEKAFAPFWEDSKTVAPDFVIFFLVRPDMSDVLEKILSTPLSVFEDITQNLPQKYRDMLLRRIILLKKEMAQ